MQRTEKKTISYRDPQIQQGSRFSQETTVVQEIDSSEFREHARRSGSRHPISHARLLQQTESNKIGRQQEYPHHGRIYRPKNMVKKLQPIASEADAA
ncbi:hypothetical protein Nepgr_033527 [Nepenthes gracilis]|uniref:Uncharacterized protein n=1 Tax=Nepenthes gracilis TaxID=150966 RepID=A0AAD3TKS8_NEPGR|nr:hypothetical protein Nepgr_033527 [Nepenthes gracilis]